MMILHTFASVFKLMMTIASDDNAITGDGYGDDYGDDYDYDQ